MQARSLLLVLIVVPLFALAEVSPRECFYPTTKVVVEAPDRQKLEVEVDVRDVAQLAKNKYGYRIIDWVQAAFAKAKISRVEEKVSDSRVITEIDGIRSLYRIDGQLHDDAQTARFKL